MGILGATLQFSCYNFNSQNQQIMKQCSNITITLFILHNQFY
jgi:hypothetical protein